MPGFFGTTDLIHYSVLVCLSFHFLRSSGVLTSTAEQYKEFGQEVKRLGDGLNELITKAQDVTSDDEPPIIYGPPRPAHDLSPLLDVCGDFRSTLEKCKKVLLKHISSSEDHGFTAPIRNIRWNHTIRPVVERLKERLAMHNRKVSPFIRLLAMVRVFLPA